MPQIPVLIPVIVAGLAVGSVIKSKTPRISKKKLLSASLVAGLLNGVYAYVVYSFSPRQASFRGASSAFSIPSTSWDVFVATSVLSGFLVVLAVLGIAMVYARTRKGEEIEELSQLTSEEEPTLTPG